MIALDIDAHGHHLSPEVQQRIEGWIGNLDDFMAPIDRGHVTVTHEGGRKELTTVRVQLWGPGRHFEASDTDRDAIKAVDRTRHALESQLQRAHDRELSSRHR